MSKITLKLQWPPITLTGLVFALKIAAIVTATLTVFLQDLVPVFNHALQNETASYTLAIPLIFCYLVYRKRKMLRVVMPLSGKEQPRNTRHLASAAGILLAAAALLLHWHGSLTLTPLEYHMLAFPLFIAGMCLILFNPQTLRQLAFPVAFLLFLTPPPPEIAPVLGFIVFATLVAYVTRDKLWKKIALLTTGIPIIYALNIVKTYATLLTISHQSSDLAQQMFQSLAGWILIFLETLLLLAIAETVFKTHAFVKPTDECPQCNQKPVPDRDYCPGCSKILTPGKMKLRKSDMAKLAAIILVAGLLITVQAPVFALTGGLPTVTINTFSGKQVSNQILPQTDQYTLEFLHRDTQFEARAKQNIGLDYKYTPLNQSIQPIWASLGIAPTQSSLNRWETELAPPKVITIDLRDIQLTQNPQITSHYFVFNIAAINKTQTVLYWFETTTFMVNSTWQEKYVEISLVAFPQTMDQLPEVEHELVALATAITGYWQPIKAWSETTMLLSQNSIIMLTATAIALTLITTYHWAEARKQKKVSLTASEKLASPSREIVKAVQETQKPATIENVAETLRKNMEQTITTEQLEQTLRELEKTGTIRSSVHNRNDQPIQTWKT